MSSLILKKQLTRTCCFLLLLLHCTPKASSHCQKGPHGPRHRLHPQSDLHRRHDPRRHRRRRVHPLRTVIHRRLHPHPRPELHRHCVHPLLTGILHCCLHRLHPRCHLHRRLNPRRPRPLRVRRVHPLRADIHRRQGQHRAGIHRHQNCC